MEFMEVLDLAIPEKRFSKEQLTATNRINFEFYYVCPFIAPESESVQHKPSSGHPSMPQKVRRKYLTYQGGDRKTVAEPESDSVKVENTNITYKNAW